MRVPDRQKQRREYLQKKAGANIKSSIAYFMLAPGIFATTLCSIGTLAVFIIVIESKETTFLIPALLLALLSAAGVFVCRKTYQIMMKADRQARAIPYVPPVTPDTLPAEEVLVRGSQQPTQEQSAVLLRAAGESADTPAEQLLRASMKQVRED